MTLTLETALANLGAGDTLTRVKAIADLSTVPDDARPRVAALLRESSAPEMVRVWAAIALAHIRDDEPGIACEALRTALLASEPSVRRAALHALGTLGVAAAIKDIAAHLHDHQEVPGAWFDDDCRPSQAAESALRQIGTPEALALLADRAAG